jgi:hypothetical protein
MALTKIGSIGINTGIAFAGVTTIATLNGSDAVLSVGGTVNFVSDVSIGGTVSIAGTLTYEDVTNVDAVGLITARDGIKVGSGITLSVDGDGFFTGVVTATSFSGAFSGDGSALTGVANTDVIFTDKLSLPDSGRIALGISSDLQIHHDGSNSFIDEAGTGDLLITATTGSIQLKKNTGDKMVQANVDGSVELYHANSKKLETASGGVTVTGTVAATSYTGDGSSLTGISVGVQTEAASISGITTYLDLTKDDHELVVTGNNTISVIGGAQGTSHTLRLQNSGISTVTLDSTYFKFPSGASPALPTASGSISLISFTVHKAGAVGVNTVLLAGASVSFS